MEKLFCDDCTSKQGFFVEEQSKEYVVKTIPVQTIVSISRCKKCGQEIYNRSVEIQNDIKVFDEYKLKMGLLRSHEIKDIRNKLGLSQQSFAKLLGFGEKSITRYENGSIQDLSHNNLIMLMKDPENVQTLWQKGKHRLTDYENDILEEYFDQINYVPENIIHYDAS